VFRSAALTRSASSGLVHRPASIYRSLVCALLFCSAGLPCPALVVFCIASYRSSSLDSSHLSASISIALIVYAALLCCYPCIAFDLIVSLVSAAHFCSAAL
jgi:hypothetical protein